MAKKPVEFESYCKRIRNFPKWKKLPYEVFIQKAKEAYRKKYGMVGKQELDEKEITENEVGIWKDEKEAEEAINLFNNYKSMKSFTEASDIELLKQLVTIDINLRRVQRDFKIGNSDRYVKLNQQAVSLRENLGLLNENKDEKDPLEHINKLKKKFKIWREKNRIAFETRTPCCGKMVLFKIRNKIKVKGEWVRTYDLIKHPFYKDKVLCNPYLWKLYKQGKITKLDIVKVLFPERWKEIDFQRYVDWLEKKIFEPEEKRNQLQKDVKND